MKPSLTFILFGIFFLLIARSMYSIYEIFQKPTCTKSDIKCYKSILNTKPDLDLYVFVSDSSRSPNYQLALQKTTFDYLNPFEEEATVEISKTARNNGSLFIHTFIVPSKKKTKVLTIEEIANDPETTYLKNRLTKFAIPVSATYNLLKDSNKKQHLKPVTHLRSRYVINMCIDELEIPQNLIPAELVRYIRLDAKKRLLPIAQHDVLQMRLRDLVEITPDTFQTKFTFVYNPNTFGKMRFLSQIEATLYQFHDLGFTEKDIDEVKGVFADTNFYLLCATVCIGSVHLLLDFLSFKNDVSFWRSHSSMAGLSSRTVLWRAFSQTIVFMFLLDEGTSLLVLVPTGVATIIEFWKVSKVLKTSFSLKEGFKSNRTESEAEKKTRQYDEECMKYLSYILYPLLVAAAVYSLVYQPQRSWYSWTINSLVNCVYAFGFLFMLPQLFINYRLKSVAALPWRAFTYKAFNTFIDDIFAFIITMPTAHRVACFRDDIVFLVYLYQRYLYPVDKTRTDIGSEEVTVNEEKKKTK